MTGITTDQQQNGLGLQVRRGSEPSLHQIGIDQRQQLAYTNQLQQSDPTKRWSAAPVCRSDTEPPERILTNGLNNGTNGYPWTSVEESELEESHHNESINNFSRSGRLSMQFLGDGAG